MSGKALHEHFYNLQTSPNSIKLLVVPVKRN
uniref:Uncharacterized protein n=1 Tax=Anguilla anguilla TaxID=7936 RepID=A0A0E9QNY8_ANGAN